MATQQEMHSLITNIESQNLDVVDLLKKVQVTTNQIKMSGQYANEKVQQELFGTKYDKTNSFGKFQEEDSEMQSEFDDERGTY